MKNPDIYAASAQRRQTLNIQANPIIYDFDKAYSKHKSRYDYVAAASPGVSLEAVHQALTSSFIIWNALIVPSVHRQSYQEAALLEYLQDRHPSWHMRILPKGGKSALFVQDGKIVPKGQVAISNLTKSLDLQLGEDIFVVHKHTRCRGGAQDNQFNDALAYLSQCRKGQDFTLVLCLDGDYYTPQVRRYAKAQVAAHGLEEEVKILDYLLLDEFLASRSANDKR